jgi:hypothetical protein
VALEVHGVDAGDVTEPGKVESHHRRQMVGITTKVVEAVPLLVDGNAALPVPPVDVDVVGPAHPLMQ